MEHVRKVLENTDWPLFSEQKSELISAVVEKTLNDEVTKINGLDGILNFIDALQDAIVEEGLVSEIEMFGKGD